MTATMDPKKVDLLSIVMIVVIVIGVYFIIFHKGITRYFYLKTQEKILRNSLASASTVDQTLQGFQDQIQNIQIKLNEFNRRLPKEKNIDEILKQITRASSQSGVNLKLIAPQEVVEGEMYKRFPIKLNLQSPFKSCFLFFRQLESLPRILQLDNITMQEKAEAGELEVEIMLSAFMLK